jgi:hypothetical protein
MANMSAQMDLFARGGLNDEGGEIDKESGNRVPIGGTKKGVRDDIPANVSEGEFVIPEDVVRYIGLEKLMAMRQKAKMGLKKMEDMGQMGNGDEATVPDDMPFNMADLIVVGGGGEPMEFANGGFVPSRNYHDGGGVEHNHRRKPKVTDYQSYMNSVQVIAREYRNKAGESISITFINGVPTIPIPIGYTSYTANPDEVPSPAAKVVKKINDNNGEDKFDKTPVQTIDYDSMTPEQFATRMKYESGSAYKVQKGLGVAIASLIPLGGPLMYGSLRQHSRRMETTMRGLIKNAPTAALKKEYTETLKTFLKENGLKSAEEATALGKVLDGFLVTAGFTVEQGKVGGAAASQTIKNGTTAGVMSTSLRPELRPETITNAPDPNSVGGYDVVKNQDRPYSTAGSGVDAQMTSAIPAATQLAMSEGVGPKPTVVDPDLTKIEDSELATVQAEAMTYGPQLQPASSGDSDDLGTAPTASFVKPLVDINENIYNPNELTGMGEPAMEKFGQPQQENMASVPFERQGKPATKYVPSDLAVQADQVAAAARRTLGQDLKSAASGVREFATGTTENQRTGQSFENEFENLAKPRGQIPIRSNQQTRPSTSDAASQAASQGYGVENQTYTDGGNTALGLVPDMQANIDNRRRQTQEQLSITSDAGYTQPYTDDDEGFDSATYNASGYDELPGMGSTMGPMDRKRGIAPVTSTAGEPALKLPDELIFPEMSSSEKGFQPIRKPKPLTGVSRKKKIAQDNASIVSIQDSALKLQAPRNQRKIKAAIADAKKSGFTGSTIGGIAIGKISGQNGSSEGVLQNIETGKVVKLRDLNAGYGKEPGGDGGKTVFMDADGQRFVKNTFGKKSSITSKGEIGGDYTGPGITKGKDKSTTPAKATAKQVVKDGVRYNKKDKDGKPPKEPADPKGNTGGYTSFTDMFDGGGPGESAAQERARGGGDGSYSMYKGGLLSKKSKTPLTRKPTSVKISNTKKKRGLAAR